MRNAWLWILILGLALGAPALGQDQGAAPQAPPAETAAPGASGGEQPGAAAEPATGQDAGAAALPAEGALAPTEGGINPAEQFAAAPAVVLPRPVEIEVSDVPNDNGSGLGVLWRWEGDVTADDKVTIETEVAASILDQYRLTPEEQTLLDGARAELAAAIAPFTGPRDAAAEALAIADDALAKAKINKDPETVNLLREKWARSSEMEREQIQIDKLRDVYMKRVGKLDERDQKFTYLSATLARSNWLPTNVDGNDAGSFGTKGDSPERFGIEPADAEKLYLEVNQIRAENPGVIDGTYVDGQPDQYDNIPAKSIMLDLDKNTLHNLRMVVKRSSAPPEGAPEGTAPLEYSASTDLGGAVAKVNFFNFAFLNNLIFAVLFAAVILSAIVIARRNPNLFIRRIQGLEAVDEAIGRATEMGKPVLYLCGMDALSGLNTLAAINILGRVARRIADYDSDLIVPCRDPVGMTVAQEVVRDAYIEQGRPDAYREDKIWFVTDDQFAYTAATCGIMMREKPAANFFMGGYYAESLLLTETGATTGAIQIAGTDSLAQLPFFITTCDYTLIGEELYAASAYLSREPMLLGSLKGQDLGKALVMILILVQTLLFAVSAILAKMQIDVPLDFLRNLVQPL